MSTQLQNNEGNVPVSNASDRRINPDERRYSLDDARLYVRVFIRGILDRLEGTNDQNLHDLICAWRSGGHSSRPEMSCCRDHDIERMMKEQFAELKLELEMTKLIRRITTLEDKITDMNDALAKSEQSRSTLEQSFAARIESMERAREAAEKRYEEESIQRIYERLIAEKYYETIGKMYNNSLQLPWLVSASALVSAGAACVIGGRFEIALSMVKLGACSCAAGGFCGYRYARNIQEVETQIDPKEKEKLLQTAEARFKRELKMRLTTSDAAL